MSADVLERLRAHPHRLTRYDRAMLFGGGELAFRKGAAPAPERGGNNRILKRVSQYGTIKAAAHRIVAGEFPGLAFPQVAAILRVDSESLKSSVWKIRHDAQNAKRGAAA